MSRIINVIIVVLFVLAATACSSTQELKSQDRQIDVLELQVQRLKLASRLAQNIDAASSPDTSRISESERRQILEDLERVDAELEDAQVEAERSAATVRASGGYYTPDGVYHNGYGYSSWWSGPRGYYTNSRGVFYPLHNDKNCHYGRRNEHARPRALRLPDAAPRTAPQQKPLHLRTATTTSSQTTNKAADHAPKRKRRR